MYQIWLCVLGKPPAAGGESRQIYACMFRPCYEDDDLHNSTVCIRAVLSDLHGSTLLRVCYRFVAESCQLPAAGQRQL